MKFGPPDKKQSQMMLLGCGSSGSGVSYTPWLDAVESKCIAAYGFQRLITGVTDATRVRDFAVAELDVGTLSDGGYDVDGFANHVAAEGGQGFAAKLYDHKSSGDLVQGTAAAQPEIIISAIGNKPAVLFTGTEYVQTAGNVTGSDFGTGDWEAWYVWRPTDLGANRALGARGVADPELYSSADGKLNIYLVGERKFDSVLTVNTNYVIRFYRHSGVLKCDINGVTESTTHAVARDLSTTVPIVFGAGDTAGASEKSRSYMSFDAWFNSALTSGEAADLLALLKTFHGIA